MSNELIGWLISAVAIAGGIAAVMKHKINFILYLTSDLAWIVWGIATKAYSQIPMWVVFSILCGAGYINWRRLEKKEKQKYTID